MTTRQDWPRLFNFTVDGIYKADKYAPIQEQFSPTEKVNTYENAWHHMLQLRTTQKRSSHGHIGAYPIQSYKYFWTARVLANQARLASASPPRTCEVGFGTGMSTALFATATSSPHSSREGGTHHIFDCRYCMGTAGGKTPGWQYLQGVFGERLRYVEGMSDKTLPRAAREMPAACDLLSIDGAHTYPQVLRDIRNARALAHRLTHLLFDDVQYEAVNRSISEAVAEGLIVIRQVFSAEDEPFDVFASNRGATHYSKHKRFVLARFVTTAERVDYGR